MKKLWYIYIYIYIYISVCVYVCLCGCVCICVCVGAYLHTCTHRRHIWWCNGLQKILTNFHEWVRFSLGAYPYSFVQHMSKALSKLQHAHEYAYIYIYIYNKFILDFIYSMPWKFVCDVRFYEVLQTTVIKQITLKQQLYGHLPPSRKLSKLDELDTLDTTGVARTSS